MARKIPFKVPIITSMKYRDFSGSGYSGVSNYSGHSGYSGRLPNKKDLDLLNAHEIELELFPQGTQIAFTPGFTGIESKQVYNTWTDLPVHKKPLEIEVISKESRKKIKKTFLQKIIDFFKSTRIKK